MNKSMGSSTRKERGKSEIKIQKPKITDAIKNNDVEINVIEDEDIFSDIYVSNCRINKQLAKGVSFKRVIFENVDLEGMVLESVDFTDVVFKNCNLSNADFRGAIIHRTEFIDCKLTGVDLTDATLQNVLIKGSNCSFALMRFIELKKVIFEDSIFKNSNFQSGDFTKVGFKKCDFTLSQMSGTSLLGIDFSDSIIEGLGVGPEDVKGAIISATQAVYFAKLLGLVIRS